jgi:DNA-binding ferritin-like protein
MPAGSWRHCSSFSGHLSTALRTTAITAEELHGVVTVGMLTDCMQFHEQAVWMLRAVVAGK